MLTFSKWNYKYTKRGTIQRQFCVYPIISCETIYGLEK